MTDFSKLSIVVPVGPNDEAWRQCLNELKVFGQEVEIILSACQSLPLDLQLPANAQWLHAKQGRAQQLNAGAERAAGEILWFVHADTRLNEAVVTEVRKFIADAGNSLGYFRLRFAGDGPWLTRVNAAAANIRSRLFDLPFGDQGFILSKTAFERLNGFDETVKPGEDLDFVVRVKASGVSLRELPAELITSARRYRHYGWLITTMRHVWLTWVLTRQAQKRLRMVE